MATGMFGVARNLSVTAHRPLFLVIAAPGALAARRL
jgi:hypothetical protein